MVRMSRHEDPVTAAQACFGDLKLLQSELASYIQQQRYKQFILNSAAAPIDPASYTVRVLTQPQFDAYRADFLVNVGRSDDARTLLTSVMSADPKNAQARETMGFLEFRAGNRGAARDWFKQSIELDSKSYLANYYFAALAIEAGGGDPQVESSLRTVIQLNPNFAPPYDMLAVMLRRNREKSEEAETLSRKAVELDRSNIGYRFNYANMLLLANKPDEAIKILQSAQPLAHNPEQAKMLASQITRARQFAESQKEASKNATRPMDGTVTTVAVSEPAHPRHPDELATGPKHSIVGTIQNVSCYDPSVLELEVVPEKSKTVALYTNNYFTLQISALGFEPQGEMNPCHDLSGQKAKIDYASTSDKSEDGQIIAIELHK